MCTNLIKDGNPIIEKEKYGGVPIPINEVVV